MVSAKYDRIGANYNSTRQADPFIAQSFYNLLNPKPNKSYLDIGCGTGNYTIAFARKGLSMIGVDPSVNMLLEAKLNAKEILWLKGSAEKIPLDNNAVNGAMAMLTIHHWSNLIQGFIELNRVVGKDGPFVLFTSTREQMKGYWLNHYFPLMMADSMAQMPGVNDIKTSLKKAGWHVERMIPYKIRKNQTDLFLYAGKHNPSLYLRQDVQLGISSFTDLANQEEVEYGLSQLEADIISGRINRIIDEYAHENGDYLFLIARNLT